MTIRKAACAAGVWILLGLGSSGCFPGGEGSLNEQKDPHFLTGKSRKTAMDYAGAAEAFDKALEANPRSASAHFELGLLHYQNLNDWAAAIYHFEKYLKLQPRSNKADLVRQFIDECKQQLVKGVPLGPVNEQVRREMEKLVLERDRLARENSDLRLQLEQLNLQFAGRTAPAGGFSASNAPVRTTAQLPANPSTARAAETPPTAVAPATVRPAATRTHVVRAGDTPYSIARSYGVKLALLLTANPGVDPRRLQPGQALTIPAP